MTIPSKVWIGSLSIAAGSCVAGVHASRYCLPLVDGDKAAVPTEEAAIEATRAGFVALLSEQGYADAGPFHARLVQTVPLNAQVPQPFRVVVTANGLPVAGLDVNFEDDPCYYSDSFCPPVEPSQYGLFVNGSNNVDVTTDATGTATSPALVTGNGYGGATYIHISVFPQVVDGVSYVESATDVSAPMIVWQGVEPAGGGTPAVSAPTLRTSILGLLALALCGIAAYEGRKR
jgi:hypothetical protein